MTLVRTELVGWGTEVLRIGIYLVGWLESDWIVLVGSWLAWIELVRIGGIEGDWIEIEADFLEINLMTGCLAGIELVDLIELFDLIG